MADTSDLNGSYAPEPPLGVFTVEIAAPGGSSADWRPFPTQELPLAEEARKILKRFELKAEVIELTADHPANGRPGIILIDPRFLTVPGGRAALEAAADGLPKWILPLLVMDRPGDSETMKLAAQVGAILDQADVLRAHQARRGASGVSSYKAFSRLLRDLLFEAERQYITHRSKQIPQG